MIPLSRKGASLTAMLDGAARFPARVGSDVGEP